MPAVVQVPAVAAPADLPFLALAPVVAHRVQLPLVALLLWLWAKAHLAVQVVWSAGAVLALVVLAAVPARLVVEPAEPVQQRLSSRSSSAAMARNTT